MTGKAYEARAQVPPEHYGLGYDSPQRWINYGLQVRTVLECCPQTVLEVGLGNGTVTALLRRRGLDVTTLDIDERLGSDLVGSVHTLTDAVPPKSFDLVLCAEVLEHLPFDMLPCCVRELAAVARRHVVIGLPGFLREQRWGIAVELRLPRFRRAVKLGMDYPLPEWPGPDSEHYWSADHKPYTLRTIIKQIERHVVVERVLRERLDPYHVILACRPLAAGQADGTKG
jgi:SAM-dependent methyltransferase